MMWPVSSFQDQLSFADTEAELAGLKGRHAASEALQAKLQADLASLQEEMAMLRERFVKATQSTKDGLKGKLQAIQEKNKATQELATLRVQMERAAYESAVKGIEVAVPVPDDASLAEIDRLSKETASLQSQLDAAIELQAETASAAASAAAATTALAAAAEPVVDEAMAAEVTSLTRENTSLQSQLDAAIEMQAETKSALDDAKAATKAAKASPDAESAVRQPRHEFGEILELFPTLYHPACAMQHVGLGGHADRVLTSACYLV